jgi:hypothetical protein
MRRLFTVFTGAVVGGMVACASAQGPTSPSDSAPKISALSPTSGAVGMSVTLTGSSFAADGNTVKFGSGYIKNLSSADGRTIRFTIPSMLDECPPPSAGLGVPCPETQRQVVAGTYAVVVLGRAANSNEVSFTVRQ